MNRHLLLLLALTLPLVGCKLAGDAEQSAHDRTLLPLAIGRNWTYEIHTSGGAPCVATDNQITVYNQTTVSGKTAFETSFPCNGGVRTYFAFDADQIFNYSNGVWTTAVQLPLETDVTWYAGSKKYTWDIVAGSVNTPAGLFSNCYTRAEGNSTSNYTQFCAGVGIVVIHSETTSGQVWEADLSTRNFR